MNGFPPLRLIVSGFLVCAAAAVFAAGADAQQRPQGNAENGRSLFVSTGCYECHGYVGQGGGAGARLNPPPPFEPFLLQLRQPRNVMIPYSEAVLSDQEAADIYAYIQTFPAPPDPASIPLLQ